MHIRVMGLPAEIAPAVELLRCCLRLRVVEVRGPYANRGDDQRVRVYVTALRRADTRDCPDRAA